MLGRRSWTFIFSLGCTLMFSGAAYTFAGTLLEETQRQIAAHAVAAGGAWGGEFTAGETPKSIPESKTTPVGMEKGEGKQANANDLTALYNAVTLNVSSRTQNITAATSRTFDVPPGQTFSITVPGRGNASRSIQVRRRTDNTIDIILSNDTGTDEGGAYYYITSTEGTLIRAAHANGRIIITPNADAQEAFAAERTFWRDWAATATARRGDTGGSSGGGR